MQALPREPNRLARSEDSARIVESYELELQQPRRPQDAVPSLDAADDLAGPDKASVVIAAQRPKSSQRDDRPLTRFHRLLDRERRGAGDALAADPPREHQPLERMHIRVERRARPRIAPPPADQRFGEDAAVRIHLEIAQVEDDADASDGVVERRVIDKTGGAVALENAFARQLTEIGVFERATHEHAQRAGHFALHRESRPISPAADTVKVRAPHSLGAIARVQRAVALPEITEAIGAGQAERQTDPPTVPVGGRLGIDDEGVAPLRTRADIEGDAPETRLRALDEANRARPVVVPGQPESIRGAVIDEWVDMIDPVVFWIWLLRREWRSQREEEKPYARVNR